jgi:hypothetical protein
MIQEFRPMMLKSMFVLIALALLAASAPAQARYHGDGWRHHRHHHGWHRGYARSASDYYHRSRQLVGTR